MLTYHIVFSDPYQHLDRESFLPPENHIIMWEHSIWGFVVYIHIYMFIVRKDNQSYYHICLQYTYKLYTLRAQMYMYFYM